MKTFSHIDPQIATIILHEAQRQEQELNLIASENYTPQAVMEAASSVLTNKYAEGYPGKRYYGGCEYVDQAELLAIERSKQLFNAEHSNVQPHAGSQANMAAYFALLNPGDTLMGMSLAMGGHLTHGHAVNFSGNVYNTIQYSVNKETEFLDYTEIEKLAHEHKPKLIVAGASAYSRAIDFEKFSRIAKNVGAYFMADIAHIAGLVATGLHQSPVPYADCVTSTTHKTLRGTRGGFILSTKEHAEQIDRAIMPGTQGGPFMHIIAAKAVGFGLNLKPEFKIYQQQILANAQKLVDIFSTYGYRIVAGGTDNHLFVLDLRNKNITGRAAEVALEKAGISISRSCIPFDPEKPWITSGIRIGTPAVTTRGMREAEMEIIATLVHEAIQHADDDNKLRLLKEESRKLCAQFPIYSQKQIV